MDKFFQGIANFFRRLFGSTPDEPIIEDTVPNPAPSSPTPSPTTSAEADNEGPQDSGDLDLDDPTVVNHGPANPVAEDNVVTEPIALPDDTPVQPDQNPQPPGPIEPGPSTPEDIEEGPVVPPAPTPAHSQRFMWCIDNGHGVLTRGKRSPVQEDGSQLFEYDFNRDVTYKIFAHLRSIGVAHFEVVPEVQVGNFLVERVFRANKLETDLPKLFVSVHANAGPAPTIQDYTSDSARGIETWFYHTSAPGRKMASIFQRHLIEQTGLNDRGLRSKTSGQFYVLRKTQMPAILTENGFYNNRLELPLLMTDAFREQVALAHVKAILEIEANGL